MNVHRGHKHKEIKKPEILRGELVDKSFDLSQVSALWEKATIGSRGQESKHNNLVCLLLPLCSEDREEHEHSFSLTNTTTAESDLEFTLSAESECGQCDFIGESRFAIEEHIVKNHSECTRYKSKNAEDMIMKLVILHI